MLEVLEPTQDPDWALSHERLQRVERECARIAPRVRQWILGDARRPVGQPGPDLGGLAGYSRWASRPRCYVAGLFDMPNTKPPALVPVADWSRVRILLDGEPLLAREGEVLIGTRKLDMRRGLLLSAWTHRTSAGITASATRTRSN